MAMPVVDRGFFAGDGTNRRYPGFVHGAFMSGQREASRLLAERGITLEPPVARTNGPTSGIAAPFQKLTSLW